MWSIHQFGAIRRSPLSATRTHSHTDISRVYLYKFSPKSFVKNLMHRVTLIIWANIHSRWENAKETFGGNCSCAHLFFLLNCDKMWVYLKTKSFLSLRKESYTKHIHGGRNDKNQVLDFFVYDNNDYMFGTYYNITGFIMVQKQLRLTHTVVG